MCSAWAPSRELFRRIYEDRPDPFKGLLRRDRDTWPLGACAHCGTTFRRSQESHRYCRASCRSAASEARHRRPPVVVNCAHCGAPFEKRHSLYRYCSRRCRVRARGRAARREDPERERERWRAWYGKNKERFKAYVRDWKRANPDREALYERRRRTARYGRPGRHSMDDLLLLFEAYDWRCAYCGTDGELTIDHRVPLSRGGTDAIENLIPACLACNSSKHDRMELDFRAERALTDFITGRRSRPVGQ